MATKVSITFKINSDKETKGAYRYQEVNGKGEPLVGDDSGMKIGSLYLRKANMKGTAPETLKVDITY